MWPLMYERPGELYNWMVRTLASGTVLVLIKCCPIQKCQQIHLILKKSIAIKRK